MTFSLFILINFALVLLTPVFQFVSVPTFTVLKSDSSVFVTLGNSDNTCTHLMGVIFSHAYGSVGGTASHLLIDPPL